MTADAGAELVAEAEGAADLQGVGQVARIERGHWRVAVDFDGHLHGGGVAVGVAVAQGELATLVPVEAHRALVLTKRAQPGDEPGFAVVWDDGELGRASRDHLPVVRVAADERFAHQHVSPALDRHMTLLRIFVADSGDGSTDADSRPRSI